MKPSRNREQMLFLTAGGIILTVILVVVAFNMVRSPDNQTAAEITPRAMVALPSPPGTPPTTKANGSENQENWLSEITPAPIFDRDRTGTSLETVEGQAISDPATQHDVAKRTGPPPPASTTEVATKNLVIPGETPKDGKPLMDKIGADKNGPDKHLVAPPQPPTVTPMAKTMVKPTPAPSPPPPPSREGPVREIREGYSVTLGAFSEEANANSVQQRVASLGLPVNRQTVTAQNRSLLRVRAGPFASRAEADHAMRLIHDRLGITGTIASAP